MSDLRISPDLSLPVDAITQAIAILARRGAGKTYTASVLVEEVIAARQPVVVLDPTGAWWGLRASADGQKPGLPVVIFGGEHGDVPLEPTAGKVIADVVIEHPGAYVIDLSGLESKAAEHRFGADFLERLYRGKATRREPLLLVVDEADGFAPQRPGPEQARTLGATESIVRRGRIRGLGVVLVTQRAAVINKNVLTQIEVLVAMQTTGPQDRAAIDEWIKGNGTPEERDEVLGSLASLERGEAWVWSPSWLRTLVRIRIRQRRTFDSSRTPEAGERRVEPRSFAKVDLEQLGERIRATAEQAKANDPAELRRRIGALERELATKPAAAAPERVVERIEVPVLNGQVDELRDVLKGLQEFGQWMSLGADRIVQAAESITKAIATVGATPRPAAQPGPTLAASRRVEQRTGAPASVASPRTRGLEAATTTDPSRQAADGAPPASDETRPLKAGARRMLSALARLHPTPLTREQLATLAGVQRGGTYSDYLRAIAEAGLVESVGQLVSLTDAGVQAMTSELGSGAPTTAELVAMYAPKLKAGARRMLDLLIERYPDGYTRAELSEAADVQRGGTYSDYLRSLLRVGLADDVGGVVRAGTDLFLGSSR
jgi:hypothetical protein